MSLNSTDVKPIRKFGLIALIFFGSLCALGIWREKLLPAYLFGALSLLGLGFILIPGQLEPIFAAWLKIAHLISRIVTTMVLALAYYLVITPSAMIKRILGGSPIAVKPDKEASSYWVDRPEPIQPKERFLKRY